MTTFKARGVDIVHLGEFHFGSTQRLPAQERLAQLKTLHDECARLSDAERLVLPGVLAEADLFRIEPDYETYAHMNVNYLRLDAVPRFADGWQPVLDALHGGRFFATTGEVLVPEFSVGGKQSGETLTKHPRRPPTRGNHRVDVPTRLCGNHHRRW